jgi:hypothetical protein
MARKRRSMSALFSLTQRSWESPTLTPHLPGSFSIMSSKILVQDRCMFIIAFIGVLSTNSYRFPSQSIYSMPF